MFELLFVKVGNKNGGVQTCCDALVFPNARLKFNEVYHPQSLSCNFFCALYLKGKLFLHRKYLDWQDKFVTEEKCSTLREVRLGKSYRDLSYTPKTSCIASFKIDWQIIQLRAFSRKKLALLTASINCLKKPKKKVFFYSHAFYSKDHLKNCVHK